VNVDASSRLAWLDALAAGDDEDVASGRSVTRWQDEVRSIREVSNKPPLSRPVARCRRRLWAAGALNRCSAADFGGSTNHDQRRPFHQRWLRVHGRTSRLMDDARSKRLRFLMARLEQLPPSITRDAVLRAAQERVEHPNPWLFSSADDQALDARLESVLDLGRPYPTRP